MDTWTDIFKLLFYIYEKYLFSYIGKVEEQLSDLTISYNRSCYTSVSMYQNPFPRNNTLCFKMFQMISSEMR